MATHGYGYGMTYSQKFKITFAFMLILVGYAVPLLHLWL